MEGRSGTPFWCDEDGYWTPFTWERLERVYGRFEHLRHAVSARLWIARVAERWVTPADDSSDHGGVPSQTPVILDLVFQSVIGRQHYAAPAVILAGLVAAVDVLFSLAARRHLPRQVPRGKSAAPSLM